MSEMGHLRRFWPIRAESALPLVATKQRTFQFGCFVPITTSLRREQVQQWLPIRCSNIETEDGNSLSIDNSIWSALAREAR
jgi:hypothetical protein